jgi:uncharacterized membrane protein required for colicin V production
MDSYTGEAKPSIFKAVLIGGLVGGVLSVVPVLYAGNCCCCLWYALGGVIAVLIYKAASAYGVNAGTGALLGLVTGVIAGVVDTIVIVGMASFAFTAQNLPKWKDEAARALQGAFSQQPQTPEVQQYASTYMDWINNATRQDLMGGAFVLGIVLLVIGTIVAVIAGIITASVAGKKQGPIQEPPPYQPV